jgi:hypothetical protein
MLVSQGHDPRRTAGEIDGLLELTFSCRVITASTDATVSRTRSANPGP